MPRRVSSERRAGGGAAASTARPIARLEVLGDTFLSVNTPIQQAAARILDVCASVQEEIRLRTRGNRAHLLSLRRGDSVWECPRADGGWYAIIRAPRVMTDEEWALTLLERDRVYVHPGHFFDFAGDGYLVLSLLPPEPFFREGVSRVVARLEHPAG